MPAARDQVVMSSVELTKMLEDASERGASRALRSLGLHDDGAARDLGELRSLLDAFRDVRKGALTAFGKAVTMLLLAGLAAVVGWRHLGN